jgi:integrase
MGKVGRLSIRQVQTAKPKGDRRAAMLSDGGNLYLQATVNSKGEISRSWIFRYEYLGQRHDIGLGSTETRGLSDARAKAKAMRLQILDGIDPLAAKEQSRADQMQRLAERARAMTFRQCFEQCLASHQEGWRNAEHRRQWRTSIEQDVLPVIGDLAVDDIGTPHVIKVLEPIWKKKPETASRIRGRIERVLAWATVRGFRSGDNPARWRGHLQEMFPSRGKIAKTNHHEAMSYVELPGFMAKLRERDHFAGRALEFTILTAARTGETLGATWSEIDLATKTWTIPASRMKAGKAHKVPLSDRAVEILRASPSRDGRIFEIGEVAMLLQLRELHGGKGPTVHGFRSSFRDWCSERTSFPPIVAEQALAHAIGSKVERAYNRTDLFEKRRRLMAEWATWCSRPAPTAATVLALAGR